MKKRLLALLLVFAMTLSMCPVNTLALEVPGALLSGEIPTQVNPLYADVLDASDFDLPEVGQQIPTNSADTDYLTEDQAVEQMRENMKSRLETFTVSVQTTQADLGALSKSLFYTALEHTGDPEEGDYLKWVWGGYRVSYGGTQQGGVSYIDYTYSVQYYTTLEQEMELDGAIDELLASPELVGADDYEKISFLYDYLCNNITYDYDNLEDDSYLLKYTAYAAMMNRTAVCQGYAVLLYRLALAVGVDARLIAGLGNGGGHAWNIVELDGLYYNADSTWDAPRAEAGMAYEYFLTSDANFGDHTRNEEYTTESFYAEYPMGATNYVHQENEVPEDAITGTCGENLTWSFNEATGVLTISGEGDMTDFGGDISIPWSGFSVTSVVVEEGVTSIGDCAFGFCTASSVTLPDTLTDIGTASFCYAMNLTSVNLPEGLISIGAESFAFTSMSEVTIPASVETIGAKAFVSPALTAIHVAEGNANYYSWNGLLYEGSNLIQVPGGYTGSLRLHDLTTRIMEYAMLYCGSVTELVIPSNVFEIHQKAFSNCSALTKVTFQGSVPGSEGPGEGFLAENLFDGMTLTVSYPDANDTWTDEAKQIFGGDITWTTYGDNLAATGYCGENYLHDESSFEEVIPGTNATWTLSGDGVMTVSGTGRTADGALIVGLSPWVNVFERMTKVVVEEGITYVGDWSFANVVGGSIAEVVLPSTLEELGLAAFYACDSLTNVELPQNLKIIGYGAFDSCTSLTNVEIPASVIGIDSIAFGDCTSLTELRFCGDAPVIIENAFANVTATAYYPANNATWTTDVMQNYGGTITWVPYEISTLVTGTCGDNLTWSFDTATGVLTISGQGDMTDYAAVEEEPWFDYLTQITTIVVEEGVTSIGDRAFAFTFVTSVTLPDTLTDLGLGSFGYTHGLFSIDLPEGLISIGECAFDNSAVQEVTVPASVETIGLGAFASPVLSAIHVAEGNANYSSWNGLLYNGTYTFTLIQVPGGYTGSLRLHDFTTCIAEYAMVYCESVTELVIPTSVIEIQQNAFAGCNALTQVTFLGNVPGTLAENLFDGMTLTVSHPDANPTWTDEAKQTFGGTVTWTTYGENLAASGYCGENYLYDANGNLSSPEDVVPGTNATWTLTGDGVMTVSGTGRTADCILFAGMIPWASVYDLITEIVVEEGITYVGEWSFGGCGAKELTLPSTLEEMGVYAFAYSTLEKVNLAEGITQIWPAAFGMCEALTDIVIPESVTYIGEAAFYGCISLTDIVIPANVQDIGDGAFACCDGITAFQVDERNGYCYSWDGLLYRQQALVQVPVTYTGALELHEYSYYIYPSAFAGCTGVTEISMPATITEILPGIFQDCTALTKVIFRGNAPDTMQDAFSDVTITVSYPDANTTWTDEVKQAMGGTVTWTTHGENLIANGYCGETSVADEYGNFVGTNKQAVPGENATWTLTGDGTLTISGTGKTPDCIFFAGLMPWVYVYDHITKVVVEEGITDIGMWSFAGGYVEELTLPTTLEEISANAFYVCSLTNVVIPENVKIIGSYAFGNCTSLTELRFDGDAPAIAEDAFSGVTATFYYPANNATWTADVMQNYGGTITWESYTRYEIIEEGTDNVVIEGKELTIHIDADHNTLVAVYLDGKLVDPAYYTVIEGSTIITFTPEFLATLGEGEHKVTAEFGDGLADTIIKVQGYTPGDITGDGKVNNRDAARLMQHLAGWDVEYVEAALDVNGDGKVNNRDAARLMQWLAGWDVTIQ